MIDLNYWAVLVAGIVGMVIGGLWYSPLLFGNMWMRLSGYTMEDMKKAKEKGMGKSYVVSFLSLLVMSYVLAYFVLGWANSQPEVSPVSIGLQTGFWLWLGFIAMVQIGSVLWDNKPWKLFFLNAAHWLAVMLAMGVILGAWR